MNKPVILPCFYPTSTLIVDDQESFLRMIEIHLRQNHLPCKTYSNPTEVLEKFSSRTQAQSMLNKSIESYGDHGIDNKRISDHPVSFDVFQLHNIVYNTSRFNDAVVIVVDHDMPQMSGPAMVEQLKETGVAAKIVMLTGAADEHVAIDLFHKHFIDKFLMKSAANAAEKLVEVLYELQWEYFYEQSSFYEKCC